MDRMVLDLIDAGDPCVERIWRTLEAQARPTYFLSWGWIENWLDAFGPGERPELAVLRAHDEPAAAFFLGRRRVRRGLVLPCNVFYVNATGSPRPDELAIGHNGLLAAPGVRRSLARLLDVLPDDWDEVYLPAVDRYAFDDLGAPSSSLPARYEVTIEHDDVTPYVDLEAVRAIAGGYEALLPASTRAQLCRTRSLLGSVELEVAKDLGQAIDIYEEMLRLRARGWLARGARVLGDPWAERFHRRLILTRMAHGEIQLARVTSGGVTLGCLYNLVYRGRVVFYQCALARGHDSNLKPGYVCHAALVEYNALAGHSTYELLGGDPRYTENLATSTTRRVWLRVERPFAWLLREDNVRRWYEVLVGERPALALRPAS